MSRLFKTIAFILLALTIYPASFLMAAELSSQPIIKTNPDKAIKSSASENPTGHRKEISTFALSKDGLYALTGDEDENNYLWEIKSGKLIREVGKPDQIRLWLVTAAFSPDSSTLIWARYRKYMPVLWDVKSGKRLGILASKEKGHKAEVVSLAFSNDGRYVASGDMQGMIVIWNMKDRSVVRRFKAHDGEVNQIVFIPGGNEFASTGMDGAIYLWSLERDQPLATLLKPSDDIVTSLSVSATGSVMYASFYNMAVKGWNVPLRTLRSTIQFNDRLINNIAVSPNGDFLAVIDEERSVLLWDIHESSVAWRSDLPNSALQAIFSSDGKSLFTSGGDNWVREWDVASGRLIRKFGGAAE